MLAPLVRFVALGALLSTFTVACAAPPASTGASEDDVNGASDEGRDDANADDPTKSDPSTKSPTPASSPAPAPAPASPPATPATPAPATEAPNNRTCQTAKDIGAIAGDDGADAVSATGACSDWLKVRVKESSSSVLGAEMKITVTLRSPTAADDFDLVVHMNTDKDEVECSAVTGKSEKAGTEPDVVKAAWGESYTGNHADDSRTVVVEVKKKTPGCSATPWTLQVQGNL
jgi:hypothetical protein